MGKYTTGQPRSDAANWRWISERGVQVTTGEATLGRFATLISQKCEEVEDIIPADGSILLVLRRGTVMSTQLRALLNAPLASQGPEAGRLHEIAVEYGGVAGPDLPLLAAQAGLHVADYINSHAAVEYSVAFLGFQPGFPYMRGLPRDLHAQRRASPRQRVAAGSVAIGAAYTGIYPAAGPGGWQVIGRTAAVLFDPQRDTPSLFHPGDRVRFVPA